MGGAARFVCLLSWFSYLPVAHATWPSAVLFPRVPKEVGPRLVREFFDACHSRVNNSNPYAPPQAEFQSAQLEKAVKAQIPKVLKENNAQIDHADILEIEKFLRREWVLESDPDHVTFPDTERAKLRALFYLADYLSAAPLMSVRRSQPMEEVAARCLSAFALNAKTLTPEVRDRLVFALFRASQSTHVPRLSDALARWVSQGKQPAGAFFSYLLYHLHDPVESEKRPPLDVVLETVDLVVKNYQESGYRSNDRLNDIKTTQDYLEVLAETALLEKNQQIHDLATKEAQRLHIVITEKRDPIYRRR